MDAITFTKDELSKLRKEQLKTLAEYNGLPSDGKKDELINILDKHYEAIRAHVVVGTTEQDPGVDYGQILLPDETPDNPKYSVKIRRIYWSTHMEDLK